MDLIEHPAVRVLRDDPGACLVALDYDGTLAPVVQDPAQAFPVPGAVDLLRDLLARGSRVALLTGRPVRTVLTLLGPADVEGLVVLGQYGAERWEGGRLVVADPLPGVAVARAALRDLPAGVVLEDKATSLVVHTRRADDPAAALTALRPRLEDVAATAGLELHAGRCVLELRPPGHDKGRALRSLVDDGVRAVVVAGDDRGDLPTVDAVDRLRADGLPGLVVCSDSAESPPELRARADAVVDGPTGLVALLRQLLDA